MLGIKDSACPVKYTRIYLHHLFILFIEFSINNFLTSFHLKLISSNLFVLSRHT